MARALAGLIVLAACATVAAAPPASAPASRPAPARPDPDALLATMLRRLDAAAGCPASRRVWCLAGAWARGAAADLPAEGVLLGITIGLEADTPDRELLGGDVTLSALVVHGDRGVITDIPPASKAEQRVVDEAIAGVARVLKGEAARFEPAPSLARYLATMPARASHPLVRTAAEWRLAGAAEARIRRTPAGVWIAVEVPAKGPAGIFVSLYPAAWRR